MKPGLSSYADEPNKGGASLQPLLEKAMETIPEGQETETPVEVRATAGLRLLKTANESGRFVGERERNVEDVSVFV